jgi:SAM-dependent methyltransferase
MADLRKFRSLARNWETLGEIDPLFGVLSDPTKHGGKWEHDEFFASGRAHVAKLMRTLSDARASFEPGACLDFGCGVGRLTVPLSESFQRTVGVDVAAPMVDAARRLQPAGARCEFVLNRDPDLRRFASGTFDVVHSCLVLQHIPPDISPGYIAEFFRVSRPGGLVVFQLPAETRTAEQISASHALPDTAYAAGLSLSDVPETLAPGACAPVLVAITNRSDVTWRHDIPAGRHICVGNHWLRDDGSRVVDDDARGFLPKPVAPGETVHVRLRVQAPSTPGRYLLEVDLVQEHICWFAQRGSPTATAVLTVTSASTPSPAVEVASVADAVVANEPATLRPPAPRVPLLRRLMRRLRGGTPTFEMHVVSRALVEQTIRGSGGELLRAVDDNAAGPGWLSYTYICRRS